MGLENETANETASEGSWVNVGEEVASQVGSDVELISRPLTPDGRPPEYEPCDMKEPAAVSPNVTHSAATSTLTVPDPKPAPDPTPAPAPAPATALEPTSAPAPPKKMRVNELDRALDLNYGSGGSSQKGPVVTRPLLRAGRDENLEDVVADPRHGLVRTSDERWVLEHVEERYVFCEMRTKKRADGRLQLLPPDATPSPTESGLAFPPPLPSLEERHAQMVGTIRHHRLFDYATQRRVVERIFAHMDIDSRLVLRATGRQWREFVDIRLADHVLIVQPNLQMNHGHPFVQITTPQRRPEWYWGIPFPGWLDEVWSWRTKEILKTARIVDVDCPAAADEVLKSLRSAVPTVQILRLKAARTACSPPAFVPSTVVFPSLDRSPGREYALPSRTVVFATEYDPAAPAHLLSTWLHFAHLNSMTLIFTPNGVGPVDNGVKPPGFLLDPLVRLLLANIRETDFTLVGVTDMPCGWFAIDTKGDGDGDGDGDEGREDKDAEQRSDAHRISAQIYERLSLVVCNEYDDDSVTRHGKLTRIVAGLKYFSLEEYKGHVGEEVFALHTVPWPSVKADKAADVLRLVKKAPRMYVDTPPASTSAGADADASNGTADLPVHAQEQ